MCCRPGSFKRIRHYGLLAQATKTERLALAWQLLACRRPTLVPPRARRPSCAAIDIDRCPHCKTGHSLVVVEQVLRDPAALAASMPGVGTDSTVPVAVVATARPGAAARPMRMLWTGPMPGHERGQPSSNLVRAEPLPKS
jgi:hypothetical protein